MEKFISLKEMSLIRFEHVLLTYDDDASAITPEAQIVIFGDLENSKLNFHNWWQLKFVEVLIDIITKLTLQIVY